MVTLGSITNKLRYFARPAFQHLDMACLCLPRLGLLFKWEENGSICEMGLWLAVFEHCPALQGSEFSWNVHRVEGKVGQGGEICLWADCSSPRFWVPVVLDPIFWDFLLLAVAMTCQHQADGEDTHCLPSLFSSFYEDLFLFVSFSCFRFAPPHPLLSVLLLVQSLSTVLN